MMKTGSNMKMIQCGNKVKIPGAVPELVMCGCRSDDSYYKCRGHGEQTEAPYPENRISDVTAHLDTRKPDGQPECRGERADECADDIADHDRVGGSNLIDTVHRNDLLHDRQQCKIVRIRIQDQFERCPEYTDDVMKIRYQETGQYHHDVLCE